MDAGQLSFSDRSSAAAIADDAGNSGCCHDRRSFGIQVEPAEYVSGEERHLYLLNAIGPAATHPILRQELFIPLVLENVGHCSFMPLANLQRIPSGATF